MVEVILDGGLKDAHGVFIESPSQRMGAKGTKCHREQAAQRTKADKKIFHVGSVA